VRLNTDTLLPVAPDETERSNESADGEEGSSGVSRFGVMKVVSEK